MSHPVDRVTAAMPDAAAVWVVPGRIEVLGKHTDYAGGRSLLCAVDRGFVAAGRPSGGDRVVVTDITTGETVGLPTTGQPVPTAVSWARYPAVVIARAARNFPGRLRGCEIAFASDLPPAAGLSSSSALIVAVFQVLADVCELRPAATWTEELDTPEGIAGYLGAVEGGRPFAGLAGDAGVGTSGGSQDHVAILCSRPGQLSQYSFGPIRFEQAVATPAGHCFVVASSGVRAEKTGAAMAAYNAAAAVTAAILDRWNQTAGRTDATVADATRSSPDAPDRIRMLLRATPWTARFEQFCDESEIIIPAATAALAANDLAEFGRLVDRSQAGAERGLGNQVPETMFLARSARHLGAVAASAFGAGFGGSVWAMVPTASAADFTGAWRAGYRRRFDSEPLAFQTDAAAAARRVQP
jgi:galactokinase